MHMELYMQQVWTMVTLDALVILAGMTAVSLRLARRVRRLERILMKDAEAAAEKKLD